MPGGAIHDSTTSLQGTMASGISEKDERRKVPETGTRDMSIT